MEADSGFTVDRHSTAQQVARVIRDRLLRGEIAPGARLSDTQLAEAFQVSRHSLRAALQILEAERLVRQNLHKGAIVVELGVDEVSDVYGARRAVELAGVRAGQGAGPDWLAEIHESLASMRTAIEHGDLSAILEADRFFHEAIVSSLQSTRIERFHRNIQAELRLVRSWHGERPAPNVFYARHAEVVAALDGDNFLLAEELLRAVIDDGERRLINSVTQVTHVP